MEVIINRVAPRCGPPCSPQLSRSSTKSVHAPLPGDGDGIRVVPELRTISLAVVICLGSNCSGVSELDIKSKGF